MDDDMYIAIINLEDMIEDVEIVKQNIDLLIKKDLIKATEDANYLVREIKQHLFELKEIVEKL